MALINCPECNKEVSDKVTICPHCGYPFSKPKEKKKVKKTLAIVLSCVFLVVISVAGISKLIEQNNIQQTNNLLQSSISNNDYEKLQQELLNIQTANYDPDRVHAHYSCALDAIVAKAIESLSLDNFDAALSAMDSYVEIAESGFIPPLEYNLSFSKIDIAFYDYAQKSFDNKDYSLALQAASICGESNGDKIKILVIAELTKDGTLIAQTYQNLESDLEAYDLALVAAGISFDLGNGDYTTLNPPIKIAHEKIKEHNAEFLEYSNNLNIRYPLNLLPEWVLSYYDATVALVDSGKKYSEGFSGVFFKPDIATVKTTIEQALQYANNYNEALSALQDYMKLHFGG